MVKLQSNSTPSHTLDVDNDNWHETLEFCSALWDAELISNPDDGKLSRAEAQIFIEEINDNQPVNSQYTDTLVNFLNQCDRGVTVIKL